MPDHVLQRSQAGAVLPHGHQLPSLHPLRRVAEPGLSGRLMP